MRLQRRRPLVPLRPRQRRTAPRVSLASTRSNPGGSAPARRSGAPRPRRGERAPSAVSPRGWGRPGDPIRYCFRSVDANETAEQTPPFPARRGHRDLRKSGRHRTFEPRPRFRIAMNLQPEYGTVRGYTTGTRDPGHCAGRCTQPDTRSACRSGCGDARSKAWRESKPRLPGRFGKSGGTGLLLWR